MVRKIIGPIFLLLSITALMVSCEMARAQQLRPGSVIGNPTATPAPPRDSTMSAILAPKGIFWADDYGATHNKIADDTPAIQAALNAASVAGGGIVYLGPYSYLIDSANISIPRQVTLACPAWPGVGGHPTPLGSDYSAIKCALYVNPLYTISNAGKLANTWVLNKNIPNITTLREAMTAISAFSGVGVTISGIDAMTDGVTIGGFATCLSSSGYARPILNMVFGDCTNGVVIDNAHDIAKLTNVELWPFVTTGQGYVSYAISDAADNGVGLYRLTVPANILQTGDSVAVANVGGAVGVNGRWFVTYVDATHVDLQGSATAPTTTGNTTIGYTYVSVGSTANLAVGQSVSGTGIPVGATIAAVWPNTPAISLDAAHAATATGSSVTMTFGNAAYTSGGTAMMDAFYRSGSGIRITASEGAQIYSGFVFEYAIGFEFATGSLATACYNCTYDAYSLTGGWGLTAIRFSGTTNYENYISGGYISSPQFAVVQTSTGALIDNIVENIGINTNFTNVLEQTSGYLTLSKINSYTSGSLLYKNSAAPHLTMTSSRLPNANVYTFNDAYTDMWQDGAVVLSGNPQIGTHHLATIDATTGLFGGPIKMSASSTAIQYYNPAGAADQKYWTAGPGSSGAFAIKTINDAFTTNYNAFVLFRGSGYTIGSLAMYTAAGVQTFSCDGTQHCQLGNATAPTIASGACGAAANGTIAAGGNDQAMKIQIGAAATTACAVTFAGTWTTAPRACDVTPANAIGAVQGTTGMYVSALSTTTLTLAGTALAGANYYAHCY